MRGHRDEHVARDRREGVPLVLPGSQGTYLPVPPSCSSTPLSTSSLLFAQAGDGYVCPGCGSEDASNWHYAKGFLLCHDGQTVKQGVYICQKCNNKEVRSYCAGPVRPDH